jgi:hypothetical protein
VNDRDKKSKDERPGNPGRFFKRPDPVEIAGRALDKATHNRLKERGRTR